MKLFYPYMTIFFTSAPTSSYHHPLQGGGPRVVVSTAAFHARVRGSVPGLGGLKETKMFLPHPRVKVSIVESLRDREVACSASDRQGSNFGSCVTTLGPPPRWPKARFISFFISSTTSRELRQQFGAGSG